MLSADKEITRSAIHLKPTGVLGEDDSLTEFLWFPVVIITNLVQKDPLLSFKASHLVLPPLELSPSVHVPAA